MKIGITCYPTYGGSGIVATELGKKLAQLGHEVHFISYALPYRLNRFQSNLYFHEVEVSNYPLFEYPPYSLSLATKMVEVIEHARLDILHVHYAIPHATSAYLAREMSEQHDLKFITTLHGTDITLIGADPSYKKIVRFSIEKSDGVTAVSNFLREETRETFQVKNPIKVIYNFIPDDFLTAPKQSRAEECFGRGKKFILTHISNFRPLKRVHDLIPVLQQLVPEYPVKLLMVGDGPERSAVEHMCRSKGLGDHFQFLGKQDNVAEILSASDCFILPSEHESFGLAALEAMACGVPCVTSDAGGLPEVNINEQTGFVCRVGDTNGYAQSVARLIEDKALHRRMGENARTHALDNFSADKIVPRYLDYYSQVLGS